MKTLNDVVVERLNKLMEERGLPQYRLALISGVPVPTLKRILPRRTNGISLKTIILLSEGLGISASEFISDESFSAKNLDLE